MKASFHYWNIIKFSLSLTSLAALIYFYLKQTSSLVDLLIQLKEIINCTQLVNNNQTNPNQLMKVEFYEYRIIEPNTK